MEEKYLQAKRLIDKSQKILLISHKRPDGDTLGASCALNLVLQQWGKQTDMACIDQIPERFDFLADINKMIREFNFRDYDLMIVSDAGASYMTRYHEVYPDIFKGDVPVINIDHHASNDNFGLVNIVDEVCPSATTLLFRIFENWGVRITPAIATALLCGIYNDTGSLMHSNTTIEVLEIAGKLMEKGGKIGLVAKKLFRTTPVSTLKLWGRALENAHVNEEGATVSVVTWRDFLECGAGSDEISGVVDFLNSVPGSKFTVLLNEDERGNIKGSFRTQCEEVDVAALAGQFGGGGHRKAAGFTMPGRLHREVHWKIVPQQAELESDREAVSVDLPRLQLKP
jgi:phosphoesterase RecJ-like protein